MLTAWSTLHAVVKSRQSVIKKKLRFAKILKRNWQESLNRKKRNCLKKPKKTVNNVTEVTH